MAHAVPRRLEASRDSEERFRLLIDELDAIVTIRDAETGERFVSARAEAVLGYPREKLVEPGFWRSLVVSEDHDRVCAVWDDDALRDAYQLEYRVCRADGSIALLDERMRSVRDASGRAIRWYGFAQDVTDLRRSQAMEERAERMAALARFAAGLAHDVRNVLWAIDLVAQGLAAAHEAPDPVAGDARLIADAIAHGTALTRQLTEFAHPRISTSETLDLDAAIRAAEPRLAHLLGDAHRLVVRYGARAARVHLDARQMETLLGEHVARARDAMRAGGSLTIATTSAGLDPSEARADGVAPGRYAIVMITDTGPAMPRAALEHVFEPYFTTEDGEKGTGVGLATAFSIVAACGGTVSVESSVGRGTVFRILLPLVAEPTATSPD